MMPPAGWYPDPQRPGLQRWWDGAQWVGQPVASPQQPLYGTAASASGVPPTGFSTPYGAPTGPWVAPTSTWGAPVPGGYYYAPPKKRGARWWTGFAVIMAALLAIVGVGVVFLVRVALDDVLAPRHVASSYLSDLRDGNYSDAYSQLCVEDQSAVSVTRFSGAFASLHPTSFRITGTSFHDADGSKNATVRFNEDASDGSSGAQTLQLVHESGDWRVCHLGQPPSTWAGTSTGTGRATLPATLRGDATLLGHSH